MVPSVRSPRASTPTSRRDEYDRIRRRALWTMP